MEQDAGSEDSVIAVAVGNSCRWLQMISEQFHGYVAFFPWLNLKVVFMARKRSPSDFLTK